MEKKIPYKRGGKKEKKLITYVLTVSKVFPSHHPRKGEQTKFKDQLLDGLKIHTIRGNYNLWKKRIDRINKGEAVLSVRQWAGKPYRSKQVEIAKYTKLGYQKFELGFYGDNFQGIIDVRIDDKRMGFTENKKISDNDGFHRIEDFFNWFPRSLITITNGIIIHFTDLRY